MFQGLTDQTTAVAQQRRAHRPPARAAQPPRIRQNPIASRRLNKPIDRPGDGNVQSSKGGSAATPPMWPKASASPRACRSPRQEALPAAGGGPSGGGCDRADGAPAKKPLDAVAAWI